MKEKTTNEWLAEALWPRSAVDGEMTWRLAAQRLIGAAAALEMHSYPSGLNDMVDLVAICLARAEACKNDEMERRLALRRSMLTQRALVGDDDE